MNNTLICERLSECRKKLGITKHEAAKRMQMSQPAYLRYESGERTPSIHVVYFMATVFGTSAEYLTGQTDDPKPTSYWIRKDIEPELFSLIETYEHSNEEMKKRLSVYMHEHHKIIENDDKFQHGTLHHLVPNNEGRVLDGRKTP